VLGKFWGVIKTLKDDFGVLLGDFEELKAQGS